MRKGKCSVIWNGNPLEEEKREREGEGERERERERDGFV
jgi:hypothetical protein